MFRTAAILLYLLVGCAAPPSTPTTATTSSENSLGDVRSASFSESLFLENVEPLDAAMLLAHGVRNRLADGELIPWLPQRASYPFDIDGKITAADPMSLTDALNARVGEWARQTQGQSRCDALNRSEVVSGHKAFHYLDRLGARPPSVAIARDLDRLGVGANDILVNCYTPNTSEAGFTVIATPVQRELRLKSFRN